MDLIGCGQTAPIAADGSVATTNCDADPILCGCQSDSDCKAPTPRCDRNTGRCFPCLPLEDNCPTGSHCVASKDTYLCSTSCTGDVDCPKTDGGDHLVCCSDSCVDNQSDVDNCGACAKACAQPANGVAGCSAGQCTLASCNPGYADCDLNPANGCEVNRSNDAANCGACGKVCGSGPNANAACVSGACTLTCAMGFADCNQMASDGCEVAISTDLDNCGACSASCRNLPNATSACAAGVCSIASCATGFADCDKDPKNGCEVTTDSDIANCGSCGKACAAGANSTVACKSGSCVLSACSPGYADCDSVAANGCETVTNSDIKNCGSCAHVCAVANGTPDCKAGACVVSGCATGFADCDGMYADGCEVSITADISNCGGCGKSCGAVTHGVAGCANGGCTIASCNFGYADCDGNFANGCEAAVISDVNNCGMCAKVCPAVANASSACKAGSCGLGNCNMGYSDCDGVAANGCEVMTAGDLKNCGGCGHACAVANGAPACASGNCAVASCQSGYADCDGLYPDGCEINTNSDLANCGACGKSCGAVANGTAACTAGNCAVGSCSFGWADCNTTFADGCETNVLTTMNCGMCGHACAAPANATAACNAGVCGIGACQMLYGDCNNNAADGCEKSLATDTANCGACRKVCAAEANANIACVNGQCGIISCQSGYADCDMKAANGCEVALNSDSMNCGACGNACAQGLFCVSGACAMCAATVDGANCAGATSLGTLPVGSSLTRSSTLVPLGREAWYTVTFTQNTNPAFHPTIQLTTNPNTAYTFDVYADCTPTSIACGEGGLSTLRTEWEVGLTPNAGSPGAVTYQAVPLPGDGGAVLIRVYRAANAVSCDSFTLTISNLGACDPRLTDCDGIPGCEANLMGGWQTCGGCNIVCSSNNILMQSCLAGVCSGQCATGFADCNNNKQSDGCELSVATDPKNCGACNVACSTNNITTPTCTAGACSGTCNTGFADCDNNKITNGCECDLSVNQCSGIKCLLKTGQPCTTPAQCASNVCTNAVCG